MNLKSVFALGLIALGALAASAVVAAQETRARLIPFNEYRASLTAVDSSAYLGRAEVRVTQQSDFEEMRQHLITLYGPIQVTHSFQLDADVYDCIPIDQQPSVRLQGIKQIALPPPAALAPAAKTAISHAATSLAEKRSSPARQVAEDVLRDPFGNATHCEARTIPMRRITLDEMTRFPTLRDFLRKSPGETGDDLQTGANPPPAGASAAPTGASVAPCPTCGHKYSRTFQNVNAWGGNSDINLWSPNVNTGAGQVFSLTQHWYMGGSGSSLPGFQTVEAGWQNYPAKYGDERSRLFIYWTADNYNTTGCYNLECSGFVQTNNSVYLGGGFTNYSTSGGAQYEMAIQVKLYRGNWWIFYGTTAFGYYPTGLYHGGQLAQNATQIQYGTESYTTGAAWPPEGSGAWPSSGWTKAAYQRNLFWINSSGGGIWESLSDWITSPSCYNINGPNGGSGAWTVNFYDGGPGGGGC